MTDLRESAEWYSTRARQRVRTGYRCRCAVVEDYVCDCGAVRAPRGLPLDNYPSGKGAWVPNRTILLKGCAYGNAGFQDIFGLGERWPMDVLASRTSMPDALRPRPDAAAGLHGAVRRVPRRSRVERDAGHA